MSDAKVPDRKSDWTAIDIFLFSNGQQSSPPRKYHIVTEQLDWWKATLNSLAKAQYGSLHSMVELYTVEGKKVETPMELSHNTAYVAVEPPESFINAGYEKYLLKATRSWEKSQDRRSSTAVVKPEEQQNLNGISNSDIKVYELTKEIKDGSVILKTIVPSTVDNQASVIVKPEATKHIMNKTNNINPLKPSDRIHRPSIQRPAIVNKNNSLISPPRTRKPSLKRKDSVKINMEATTNRSSDLSNIKAPSKNKIYKPIQKDNSLLDTLLAKVEESLNEVKSSSSLKLDHDKNFLTKTAKVVNVVHDKEDIAVSNVYKNDNNNKLLIAASSDIPTFDIVNRQGAVHELFDENHQSVGTSYDKIENEDYNNSGLVINVLTKNDTCDPPLIEQELSSPIITKMNKTKYDGGEINKEGTVNLKLNIEIWNGSSEPKITPNTAFIKDSLIILSREKGSQVNIEDKVSEPDKPFHKVIANEMSANEDNHNRVIVNCTCHGSNYTKNNVFPIDNGNRNFVVFLPVLKLDENCKRCDCKEKDETHSTRPSVAYPVKKNASCMSLHKEKAEKIVSHTEVISRNNSTEIKIEANSIHDKNELTMMKRKSVAIREDQVTFPEMETIKAPISDTEVHPKLLINLEPEKSGFMVLKKESTGILQKSANKFTQTEWCDVLLEVKLQNDGHYSFHMPSLELLKNYKL